MQFMSFNTWSVPPNYVDVCQCKEHRNGSQPAILAALSPHAHAVCRLYSKVKESAPAAVVKLHINEGLLFSGQVFCVVKPSCV